MPEYFRCEMKLWGKPEFVVELQGRFQGNVPAFKALAIFWVISSRSCCGLLMPFDRNAK